MTSPFTPSPELIEKTASAVRELLRNPPLVEIVPKPTIDDLEKRINAGTDGNLVIREDGSIWERQPVFSADIACAAIAVIARELGEEAAKCAEGADEYLADEPLMDKLNLFRAGRSRAAAAIRAKFGSGE